MTMKQENVRLTCLHRLCRTIRTHSLVLVDYKEYGEYICL